MSARLFRGFRIAAVGAVICTLAFTARLRPVGAEPQGVLGQHFELLERNARAFERKDEQALASDLTADYVRTDLFGRNQTREQELEAERQLFKTVTHLYEFSQPVRLTVQGGDATHPTVAKTLVETRRSATITGSDGRSHETTWETVTTETRLHEGATWKCSRREELKRRVTIDGAPSIVGLTAEGRGAWRELQSAYDALAATLDGRTHEAANKLLSPAFMARSVDEKTAGPEQFLGKIEQARKAAIKTEYSFEITGVLPKKDSTVVIAEHIALRQAPDAQGVYQTVRHRVTSRDLWEKNGGRYLLKSTDALLDEPEVVQPIRAAGWQ